ncbi:hypothetical protein Desti_4552 [Desulfomonile tiedjei DSM 6799]|uniref:Uncharacterized protein n=1 Tax=Desulfomonile tiedjei (strain ATCC 49306 / DSM 6799 / DCB-1) TaxID=706587 RepID=I4CC89_DESTA|nr:hypothetical protein Desti_4552 [Desulfomonile tiedjei DSM 6799]
MLREVDVPLEPGLDASGEQPGLGNSYLQAEQNGIEESPLSWKERVTLHNYLL